MIAAEIMLKQGSVEQAALFEHLDRSASGAQVRLADADCHERREFCNPRLLGEHLHRADVLLLPVAAGPGAPAPA